MKRLTALLLLFCVVCCLCMSVSAVKLKIPGIITKSLSKESREKTAGNLKLGMLDNDNYKVGIISFDVSEDGKIALAINHNRIYVYDAYGNFLYGYHFYTQGAYGVVFCGENVAIYLVRGDALAVYDPAGNCIDLREVIYPDNSDSTELYQRTSIQHAGKTYMLQRDVELLDTYARLVVTDAEGNQNMLYDISTQHSIGVILKVVGFVGFFALIIILICKRSKEVASWDGTWYCEELKLQVSLDDYQNSFFMDGEERIWCKCYLSSNRIGVIEVFCREYDHPQYRYGKTIFVGEVKYYDGASMRVSGRKSWQEHIFVRID